MSDLNSSLPEPIRMREEFKKWSCTIDWKATHKRMKYLANELPDDLENESIKLMNRGWFIWFLDGHMPDLYEKINSLIGRSDKYQDSYLEKYINENTPYFESELCLKHSSRENQIKDAFKSHASGIYFASIPTFLALSEGIGRDLYPGIGIFSKHKSNSQKSGLPRTDDIFDEISGLDVFEEAVLKPLRVSSEVTKSIYRPSCADNKLLNRHLIMHGNSDQYGTRENSLKSISLAYFVHKSLEHLKNTTST